VLLAVACTVGDVDYTGKTCTDTCPNGGTCVDGTCATIDSLVYVTGFHVAWVTPNSIRWAWTLQGQGPNLASYQLAVTSPAMGAAGAKTWTSADNEELGGYQIKQSSGFDIVTGTITWGLDPVTEYDAVLQVTDINGKTFHTQSVRAVTDTPRASHMVIFSNALDAGNYTFPPLGVATGCGLDGGPCLATSTDAGLGTFQNLRVAGLGLTPDTTLTDKLFQSAYVEFWIRGIGTPGSSWSDVWLQMLAPDGGPCIDVTMCLYHNDLQWIYHPDMTSPGVYRRVQLPLSQFVLDDSNGAPIDGGNLTFTSFAASVLNQFNAGCPYGPDAVATFLDQIVIYW
jgi:hypothetical protein